MRQIRLLVVLTGMLWLSQPLVCQVHAQTVAGSRAAAAAGASGAKAFARRTESLELNVTLLLKLLALGLLILIWVGIGDWINRDSQTFSLGYRLWNSLIYFPFAIVLLALFFSPASLVVRLPIVATILLATAIPYVVKHNKNVEPHQSVLTGPWWRYVFARLLRKIGIEISSERKAGYELGADVDLMAMGSDDPNDNNANLITARHSPGYLLLKDLIVEMVGRRAERALLDYTKQAVNVRHEVDGVWHNGEPRDRESGDVMLAVIKTLANLDVKERRHKQAGRFGAKYDGKVYLCPIVSQGVASGERVIVTLQGEKQEFRAYADLGMREGLIDQWAELMASDQGLLILSTMPANGLNSITDVSLTETDRLMRDFVAIEEVNHPEREIQNVSVNTYDDSAGETPASILPKLIRTYPNVYVIRDLVNPETAQLLFNEIRDERLVITNIRAREACEALLRILQLKVSAKDFSQAVKAVLYQRLVRLLCPECKVAYVAPPEVLRKLGIPKGKVEKLYRPPKPEEIEKPCPSCGGLGYRGRTGIFELLLVTDQMREILVKQPKIDLLKKAARASHQRTLQEEGIVLVAKGETSIQELMRVLKV